MPEAHSEMPHISAMCRWDPPVYPGLAPAEDAVKGSRPKVESAFAHSKFPPKLTGWEALRDSNLAEHGEAEVQQEAALQGTSPPTWSSSLTLQCILTSAESTSGV